jgi:hypothetical protein
LAEQPNNFAQTLEGIELEDQLARSGRALEQAEESSEGKDVLRVQVQVDVSGHVSSFSVA